MAITFNTAKNISAMKQYRVGDILVATRTLTGDNIYDVSPYVPAAGFYVVFEVNMVNGTTCCRNLTMSIDTAIDFGAGYTYVWEYYIDGYGETGWHPFTSDYTWLGAWEAGNAVVDNTNGFQNTGTVTVTWDPKSIAGVAGDAGVFKFRHRITAVGTITNGGHFNATPTVGDYTIHLANGDTDKTIANMKTVTDAVDTTDISANGSSYDIFPLIKIDSGASWTETKKLVQFLQVMGALRGQTIINNGTINLGTKSGSKYAKNVVNMIFTRAGATGDASEQSKMGNINRYGGWTSCSASLEQSYGQIDWIQTQPDMDGGEVDMPVGTTPIKLYNVTTLSNFYIANRTVKTVFEKVDMKLWTSRNNTYDIFLCNSNIQSYVSLQESIHRLVDCTCPSGFPTLMNTDACSWYKQHTVDMKVLDSVSNPISSATVTFKRHSDGTVLNTFTTNSDGYVNSDYGTASTGTTSALNDTSKSWTTNAYCGQVLYIISGTGSGQKRYIYSNTATQLIPVQDFDTAPANDSVYIIRPTVISMQSVVASAGGSQTNTQNAPFDVFIEKSGYQTVEYINYNPEGNNPISLPTNIGGSIGYAYTE